MRIDLHTHSTCSDGTTTPAEVVREARAAGLDVVALTDHDTVQGWDEAELAAREVGIDLVRGIEVSCERGGISVHLLAYLPGRTGALYDELERARRSRTSRAERIVERLAHDLPITFEEVQAQAAPGATLGRPHIADAMVAAGLVTDRSAAFAGYLRSDGPYNVGHYAPDPVEAVQLVRSSGGVPVMAHPFAASRGRIVDEVVIHEMVDAGLVGIEAHHRDHSSEQVQRALDLAQDRGLVVTGSSDFHGDGKPNRLGENLTQPAALNRLVAAATSETAVIRAR